MKIADNATGKEARNRNYGMDAVRGTGISVVVVAHSTLYFGGSLDSIPMQLGRLGMEVFFILSGFLIGTILVRESVSPFGIKEALGFLIRRWFRTLPNYYLFLAINLLLASLYGRVFNNLLYYATFTQNLLWSIHSNGNGNSFDTGMLVESWSLTIEEWFYLTSTLVLLLISQLITSARWRILLLALIFSGSGWLFRYWYLAAHPETANYHEMYTYACLRFDSIMFGIGAAYVRAFHRNIWLWRRLLAVAGAGLLLLSCRLYFALKAGPTPLLIASYFTVTSLSLTLFIPICESMRRSEHPISGALTSLSLWSYSLYLSHLPIGWVYFSCFRGQIDYSMATDALLLFGYLTLTVIIGGLCHIYYERPMTDLRERFSGRKVHRLPIGPSE